MNYNIVLHHLAGDFPSKDFEKLIDSRDLIKVKTDWAPIHKLSFYNPIGEDEAHFNMQGYKYNDQWQGEVKITICSLDYREIVHGTVMYLNGKKHGLVKFVYGPGLSISCMYDKDRLVDLHDMTIDDKDDSIWVDDQRRYENGKTICIFEDVELSYDKEISVSINQQEIWKIIK